MVAAGRVGRRTRGRFFDEVGAAAAAAVGAALGAAAGTVAGVAAPAERTIGVTPRLLGVGPCARRAVSQAGEKNGKKKKKKKEGAA